MCSDGKALSPAQVLAKAEQFLFDVQVQEPETRIEHIRQEIQTRGSYTQESTELALAVKQAWRNASRCIGRLYWPSLKVIDARDAQNEDDIFDAICHHLRVATNDGKIKPYITLFPQSEPDQPAPFRIINDQVIRYGYFGDGLGDPQQDELTTYATSRGWQPDPTPFQILPLFIQKAEQKPRMYFLPPDAVLEVPIRHPEYPQLDQLELRWHALPMISNMALHAGGLTYACAPFNGWYMAAEIGTRNFADSHRYNLLPRIAEILGWDTKRKRSLWRDRALLILNEAVLISFEEAGVMIQDHHSCSHDFQRFVAKEKAAGRAISGDWRWLVPPSNGSLSPIFHQDYQAEQIDPNFYYLPSIDHTKLG